MVLLLFCFRPDGFKRTADRAMWAVRQAAFFNPVAMDRAKRKMTCYEISFDLREKTFKCSCAYFMSQGGKYCKHIGYTILR